MQIIDNFLPDSEYDALSSVIESPEMQWYFSDKISGTEDGGRSDSVYFRHTIYDYHQPMSDIWPHVSPFLNFIKPKALIRAKVNLYLPTDEIVYHDKHVDFPFRHHGALYYINDNDGVTTMHDGTQVKSVANRLVLFDSSLEHFSSSCTNTNRRLTMNFNYL